MRCDTQQPIQDPTARAERFSEIRPENRMLVIGPHQREILDVVRRSRPRALPPEGYPFSDTRVAVERDAQGDVHHFKIVRATFASPTEIHDLAGSSPHGRTIYELKADFVRYLASVHLPFLVLDTATGCVHSQRFDLGRRIRRGLPARPDTDWNRNDPHNGGTGYEAADWFDYRIARNEHGFHLCQVFWGRSWDPVITELHTATVADYSLDEFEHEIYFYTSALDKPVLLLDRVDRAAGLAGKIPVADISADL